jgi:hypothetical protein
MRMGQILTIKCSAGWHISAFLRLKALEGDRELIQAVEENENKFAPLKRGEDMVKFKCLDKYGVKILGCSRV